LSRALAKPVILTGSHGLTQIYADLICFGADADEFEEADGGTEDDAADQAPRLGFEPSIHEITNGAKGSYGGE
jgi:hypothetical protein